MTLLYAQVPSPGILVNFKKLLIEKNVLSFGEEIWSYLLIMYIIVGLLLTFVINRGNWYQHANLKTFLWFLILSIGAFVVQTPNFIQGFLHVDESQHIGEALTLANDPRFWLSVDGTTVGPIAIYLPACLQWVGLEINYFTIRVLNVFLWVVITVFIYKSFTLYYSIDKSKWYTLILFAIFPFFFHEDYVSYNGEVSAIMLIIMALYFMQRGFRHEIGNPLFLFIIGVLLTLAPFAKLQVGPICLMLGLYQLFLIRKNVSNVLFLLSGVLLPLFLVTFYLFHYNLIYDFFHSYLLNNLSYTSTGIGLQYKRDLLTKIARLPFTIFEPLETRLLFLISFLTLFIFCYKKISTFKSYLNQPRVIAIFILFLSTIFVIYIPGHKYYHYVLLLIPSAVLIFVILLRELVTVTNQKQISIVIMLILTQAFITAFEPKDFTTGMIDPSPTQIKDLQIVEEIKQVSSAGERLAIWGYGTFLYSETGLLMGTRDTQTHRHILTPAQQEYYLNRYLQDMQRLQPELFVDTIKKDGWLFNSEEHRFIYYPQLKEYINYNYTFYKEINGAEIFIRKDLNRG